MLSRYRSELICDFAETYHIYDMFGMPARQVAILASGLGLNSRVMMKMAGLTVPLNTFLLATATDRLSFLCWSQTEDARKGKNRPKMIVPQLLGQKDKSTLQATASGADFDILWKRANRQEG